jgi:hypothetical protein
MLSVYVHTLFPCGCERDPISLSAAKAAVVFTLASSTASSPPIHFFLRDPSRNLFPAKKKYNMTRKRVESREGDRSFNQKGNLLKIATQ